ncbi:hypothetical protein MHB50_15990 [Siminovitchia sp. FSL H7-0308]|uniref:hypothetical protein n=1 Tax=Siminovitchia sp. FSL H7-0308 TaxID=2921432 RepID=UPI0030EE6FE4
MDIIFNIITGIGTGLLVYVISYSLEKRKRVNQEKHRLKQELLRYLNVLILDIKHHEKSGDDSIVKARLLEPPYSIMSNELDKNFKNEVGEVYKKIQKVYSDYFAEYATLKKAIKEQEESTDVTGELLLRQLCLHEAKTILSNLSDKKIEK